MKLALCSVVSDEFVAGFICMYRTLVKHNPGWASHPFFVLSQEKDCHLSEKGRELIKAHCDQAVFVEVNKADYAEIHHCAETIIGTPPRLLAAFYILEAFRLRDFDLVVALDADLLVLGSLEELLWETNRFSAARARDPFTDGPLPFVNTGVMVIGDRYLDPDSLRDFTRTLQTRPYTKGIGNADQAIINLFFQNRTINYLSPRFNYTKRSIYHQLGKPGINDTAQVRAFLAGEDVRVFHYVGKKPWETRISSKHLEYLAIEDLWYDAFYEVAQPGAMQWLDRQRRTHYTEAVKAMIIQQKAKQDELEEKSKKSPKKSA